MILDKAVTTPEEVEAMRVIRNAGREMMTGDTREISVEEQAVWWQGVKELPREGFIAIALYAGVEVGYHSGVPDWQSGRIVGYGILSRRHNGLYVSLAVAPSERGKGFARRIYSTLAGLTNEAVYAEIRMCNIASWCAAQSAGYKLITIDQPAENVVFAKNRRSR